MSGEAVLDRCDHQPQQRIADSLRAQWRMFERVTLAPAGDGSGFHATIQLSRTIVRGAIEQQGLHTTPANLARAERRRARAISECVQRFNASRPPAERISDYEVI